MIEDKEVGELWHEWHIEEGKDAWPESTPICDLIRKLVEERVKWYREGDPDSPDLLQLSLHDFGIDPDEWPE